MTSIYSFRLKTTGERYIGYTNNYPQTILDKYGNDSRTTTIGTAIRQNGASAFEVTILERYKGHNVKRRVRKYIDKFDSFNNGFNRLDYHTK